MSNIAITRDADDLRTSTMDILEERLETSAREGPLVGYAEPMPTFDDALEDRIATLFASHVMPRLSGV